MNFCLHVYISVESFVWLRELIVYVVDIQWLTAKQKFVHAIWAAFYLSEPHNSWESCVKSASMVLVFFLSSQWLSILSLIGFNLFFFFIHLRVCTSDSFFLVEILFNYIVFNFHRRLLFGYAWNAFVQCADALHDHVVWHFYCKLCFIFCIPSSDRRIWISNFNLLLLLCFYTMGKMAVATAVIAGSYCQQCDEEVTHTDIEVHAQSWYRPEVDTTRQSCTLTFRDRFDFTFHDKSCVDGVSLVQLISSSDYFSIWEIMK